jgi:nicotinate phosphoribosyltransferase
MMADVITLAHEETPAGDAYVIFDPSFTWKRKTLVNFTAVNIRERIFDKGRLVYKRPSVNEIRDYCMNQITQLWDETLRFENPQTYYVDLSQELWGLRTDMIEKYQKK